MTLSPFEAERREFGTAAMGYRKRDVDGFIDEVQRSLRELWQERGETREENERLKERLTRFEQIEEQLKNTLLLAQDSAEKAHDQARRESDLIMREASQKSRDIVHVAHEEKQKLEMVLRDLHGAEQEARQRLRAMSGAILSHLDDTEALVSEGTGNFRAVVQAYPEASVLQTSGDALETTPGAPTLPSGERRRVDLSAPQIDVASSRIDAVLAAKPTPMIDEEHEEEPVAVAAGETADSFFDAPPTFDPKSSKRRFGRKARPFLDVD